MIQEEVRNRRFGEVVRLEVSPDLPHSLRELLLAEFNADQAAPVRTARLRTTSTRWPACSTPPTC